MSSDQTECIFVVIWHEILAEIMAKMFAHVQNCWRCSFVIPGNLGDNFASTVSY